MDKNSDRTSFQRFSKQILRVLIVDDVLVQGKKHLTAKSAQETVRNYFCAQEKLQGRDLYVDFADTPEEGVAKWQNGIYDLTLVDSDFQKTARMEDETKRSFLDLDVEFIGAYLYRFLYEMWDKDQKKGGPHLRDGCRVVLWTGLKANNPKDVKDPKARAEKLLSILGNSLTKRSFVPKTFAPRTGESDAPRSGESEWGKLLTDFKKPGCVASIEEVIDDVVNSAKQIGLKSRLARALTWYQTLSPLAFSRAIGLPLPVSEGWISCDGNGRFSFGKHSENDSLYLSPSLRTSGRSIAERLNSCQGIAALHDDRSTVECKCSLLIPDNLVRPDGATSPEGSKGVIAAASPLTGCSAVGKKHAIKLMQLKIAALLHGSFRQVVLKTVYLNEPDKKEPKELKGEYWPVLQVQSHHRTRCLRSAAHPRTLWNAGTTASESFNPQMMHDFLWEFAHNYTEECTRTIVSLGSKFPQHDLTGKPYRRHDKEFSLCECEIEFRSDLSGIWDELFGTLFKEENLRGAAAYPMVEINVRHYLRECVAFHLGGDEYLSPAADLKESITRTDENLNFTGSYKSLDSEFKVWLEVLDSVAGKYRKTVLLKLPFRSDILHFVQMIKEHVAVRKDGNLPCSICGVTLINAYKSGAVSSGSVAKYSPAWYGRLDEWGNDSKKGRYQVSGEMLKVSRYQLLDHVFELVSGVGLQVHLSGGIMDLEDIKLCHGYKAAVQVGTWALLDLNLSKQVWFSCTCGASAKMCKANETDVRETKTEPRSKQFKPRIAFLLHELCNGCGKCSRTYYCDTFLDRRGYNLPPVMDLRNCTGCGLCAQVCPNGAIQLFAAPEHVVILIAEESQLREWHRRLNACEIPHLPYSADYIRTDCERSGNQEQDPVFSTWDDVVRKEGDNAEFLRKCMVIYVDSNGKIIGRDSNGVEQNLEWTNACELQDENNTDWLAGFRAEVKKRLKYLRRSR